MDDINSRGATQGYPSMDWTDSEEQTWKETEREVPLSKEENVSSSAGRMTDCSNDDTDKVPPLQPHTLREFEQHLNDLKKENFSLKLRIYFLEERIQQKFEDSSDDVYRTNIELKVEVESLKQELQEKQQLLDKALTRAESLTNHNEAEVQRRCDERQQEINHMQEVLETRRLLLEEEAELTRGDVDRMATLGDTCSQNVCVTMEMGPSEPIGEERSVDLELVSMLPDRDKDRVIEELRQALCSKERMIVTLTGEKKVLGERVEQLEEQVQDLGSSLLQKETDAEYYQEELGRERLRIQQEMQSLVEEQQSQLNQYECAAGQCVSELQKAQLQVQSLQAKIHESEANNKNLQEKLSEMECELRLIRQAAQAQERTIQGLNESISTKDNEAQELYQLIEGQNATLCKLREMAHRNQIQQTGEGGGGAAGVSQLQSELVGLQSSLFTVQLELEASQRAQRQSQRQADDQSRTAQRLQGDLQEALQHREATEKHNQDLRGALHQARSELQEREGQLRDMEARRSSELQDRDKSITQLRVSLQDKDRLLQEYGELLEPPAESARPRDVLLDKLRSRIRDRDKALERSIDEKFRCLEEKEEEVRRLHQAIREKERDLERLRTILANNEETITSLDALVRGKDLELQHVKESSRKLQGLRQESEEKHTLSLRERDTLINQLQTALHTHSKETEELRATLLSKVCVSPSEAVEELRARLQLKERLLQELLSDRTRQAQEHHAHIQDLLNTIATRDQQIEDCTERLRQVIGEQTGQVKELRQQLLSRERELGDVGREREKERESAEPVARELERVQNLLKEKEAFIQELMQGQEDSVANSRSTEEQHENRALKDELQMAVKKLRENQLELTALRSSLASKQDPSGASLQTFLEHLVSDHGRLNETLTAEKKLYQNLVKLQSCKDSAERLRALHTELDSVQALRGQLEEVLMRSREAVLVLEKATKTKADFGELSTEEEDTGDEDEDQRGNGSSDEFTDSIEDEDVKLTAQSLAITQNVGMSGGQGSVGPSQSAAVGRWKDEVQQLLEQKKTVEVELAELKHQLRKAGYKSLAQMRSALLQLQAQNDALKERCGAGPGAKAGAGAGGSVTCRGWEQSDSEEEEEEEEEEEAMRSHEEHHVFYREEVAQGDSEQEAEDSEEEEEEEEEEMEEMDGMGTPKGKRGPPTVKLRERQGKRRCTRPHSLDLGTLLSHRPTKEHTAEGDGDGGGADERGGDVGGGFWQHVEAGLREQAERLRSDLALSRQENRELQERLMVSEATVHAQADQLKDYRELLTETSVQQDSKLVQVDLQDLGYETSGRSENEAEREDASSPEFDDLEMCTSLSRGTDYGYELKEPGEEEEELSLKPMVQDLRSQLSRCHRVIRSLQLRVRSLSTTSDYASSLERTPRKVNWAFQPSPAHSGLEEDEGWQSDGPRPQPSRELKELVTRVASLENQLKACRMEGAGPGEDGRKYNTLIQAQARELSHLRQRMREGRGICHILTQHLGDTTKAFEELLRANDIDYYMGQSFREQLSQSTSLAQRVSTKISGRDRSEMHDDKTGHELLALRLSKELQQKDKIIESLHTKLQQRPDTPSSCRALSETTDQSDRTSFVSDERGSTNEELELCSDMDGGSEYALEGQADRTCPLKSATERPSSLPLHKSPSTPVMPADRQVQTEFYPTPQFSSVPNPKGLYFPQGVNSVPMPRAQSAAELHQYPQALWAGTGFMVPHAKALSSYSLAGHPNANPNAFGLLSHPTAQQPHPGYTRASNPKINVSAGDSSALWDMDNMMQPMRGFSGSSEFQSGGSHTGAELIEEHLREIRSLRQRLEESIRANERLRQQLEDRLTGGQGGAPTNIYIQGLDSVSQLSNEIRALKEENVGLKTRLQSSRDSSEEVLCGRVRLQQAELEAGQWKEELRRLQTHSCEQSQQIQQLRQERQSSQELTNRLQHEVGLLQQQLGESRQLLHSLQCELQVYDRVCANSKSASSGYLREVKCSGSGSGSGVPAVELAELLVEVRGLRAQLEHSVQENSALRCQLQKQLEQQLAGRVAQSEPRASCLIPASPLRESMYRRQLLHDPAPSPPVRDTGLFPTGTSFTPYTELEDVPITTSDSLEPHADLEGEAPDGSFANRNGRHAIGHVDDYNALQQQMLEGKSLVQRMEAALQASLNIALLEASTGKALDYGSVKSLLSDVKTLRQILEEASSLLKMFWRAALPNNEGSSLQLQKEQTLKEEIHSLRLRISEQEDVLQGTIQRLRSTNRTKESMEHFIVSQLSRTRDVLKKARSNLEKNELRISSLSSSSSSSSLCHAKVPKGAYEGRPDRAVLSTSEVTAMAANQRSAKKRGRECLLQPVSC